MWNPGLPSEWNISDQIRRETSDLAKSYEVSSLRSDVGSLERSLWDARSEADGLRSQLQEVAQGVTSLTEIVNRLLDRVQELETALADAGVENDLVRTNGPFGVGG